MPLIETRGAGSAQGFGEFAQSAAPVYIEDVFSTTLYAGTNAFRAVDVGLSKLAVTGGLCWFKGRTTDITTENHKWYDTARSNNGGGGTLVCNPEIGSDQSAIDNSGSSTTFYSTGTSITLNGSIPNNSNVNYAVWTFAKRAKFFDIVTYTGDGSFTRTISHSLGSTPGCVIIKRTGSAGDWYVWHRSIDPSYTLYLNATNAASPIGTNWAPSSTTFTVTTQNTTNTNGGTYVAYLFAHDAGGFGLSGSDNVISCGSYTGTGAAGNPITLGYEPQWVLIKRTDSTGNWNMQDIMRQMSLTNNLVLYANLSNAEFDAGGAIVYPTATGFTCGTGSAGWNASGGTYIYIAIRRGPMKVPTSGTSVFYPQAITQADTIDSTSVPFPPDLVDTFSRNGTNRTNFYMSFIFVDRLRGLGTPSNTFSTSTDGLALNSSSTAAEDNETSYVQLKADSQNITRGSGWNSPNYGNWINYFFRRAPGFFDVVCYTGTGSATTFSHNLGVAPELVIVKWRSGATGEDWPTMCTAASSSPDKRLLYLDLTAAGGGLNGVFANSSGTPVLPTSTQVYIGTNDAVNKSAATYVAYLFATVAGVSKVGSYTGTGTTKQIDCGFTGGARFVLIKRTDSTGDWYVWDTARGIVSGNDPYLLLNSTAAEVTNTDYVDTYSAGFELSSTAPAALNANGGTYIFLAIA